MWISKKKYKQLEDRAEFWKDEYYRNDTSKVALIHSLIDELRFRNMTIEQLNAQLEDFEAVKTELQKYKQKYADEVTKRITLIQFYEVKE